MDRFNPPPINQRASGKTFVPHNKIRSRQSLPTSNERLNRTDLDWRKQIHRMIRRNDAAAQIGCVLDRDNVLSEDLMPMADKPATLSFLRRIGQHCGSDRRLP